MGKINFTHTIELMVLRKRLSAIAKNTLPIVNKARNCGQTMEMSAPRYKIPWASATKWVVGATNMMFWTSTGMLSRGVMPPESMVSGNRVMSINNPNCGIERASVPRKIPIDVVANRCNSMPSTNNQSELCSGTASIP